MKQYYTLTQNYIPEHRPLEDFLDEQGFEYHLGADLSEELKRYGYLVPAASGTLIKTYKVLLNEHELSAIKLSVDGVCIIENRPFVKVQNRIRSYFSWILD